MILCLLVSLWTSKIQRREKTHLAAAMLFSAKLERKNPIDLIEAFELPLH